ncbi:MAG: 2-succinylbenzoate--CoA ligase, partial [Deltaproteobacteria bacterium]
AAVPAGARGLVVFTSGTTGAPKPVELTPRMLFASATASASVLGWRDGDRWLCPLPVAHVGGLSVITRCVIARATAVIDDLDGFERHRATLGSIVPAQLPALCDRDAPPAVRAVLVGGAAAPERLLARARARGWPLLRTYGMTEACSQVATERAPGAGLRPLPGIDVRIASDGRIEVSGPTVAGGRLRTGDLGRWTADGGLVVLGRADDVIVTGGENVHPALVEDALRSHPAIADACAFGLPDERWGQIVGAAIVAPAGVDDADLAEHLGRSLPAFARPRRVALVDALPLTAAGKADRRAAARLSTRPFPRG